MDTELIKTAFNSARNIMLSANEVARSAISFCTGKLRYLNIDHATLKALKLELQDFDAAKMKWKKRRR